MCAVGKRSEGIKSVISNYKVSQSYFLNIASDGSLDRRICTEVPEDDQIFPAQIYSVCKVSVSKIKKMLNVKGACGFSLHWKQYFSANLSWVLKQKNWIFRK